MASKSTSSRKRKGDPETRDELESDDVPTKTTKPASSTAATKKAESSKPAPSTSTSVAVPSNGPPEKRKRGRPPKVLTPEEKAAREAKANAPKKPRGRPPKKPKVAPEGAPAKPASKTGAAGAGKGETTEAPSGSAGEP